MEGDRDGGRRVAEEGGRILLAVEPGASRERLELIEELDGA